MDKRKENGQTYGTYFEEDMKEISLSDNEEEKVEDTKVESSNLIRGQSSKEKTRRNKLTAVLVIVCVIVGKINVSMIAPTFPKLAMAKGIGPGKQSFVFNIPDIVGSLAMIMWGKVMPRLGLKFTLVLGVVSMGVIGCLFGMLEFLPAGNGFYVASLAIRIFEGKFYFLINLILI